MLIWAVGFGACGSFKTFLGAFVPIWIFIVERFPYFWIFVLERFTAGLMLLRAVCHHMPWGLADPTFSFGTIVGIKKFEGCLDVIPILLRLVGLHF